MEFFWQDVRFGVRTLLKSRAFTVVALLTLALGIGANTTIFTLVNALLFRPLAYADPDRLVMLRERSRQLDNMSVAYLNYQDWRRQQKSFDNMGAFRGASFNLTGGELRATARVTNLRRNVSDSGCSVHQRPCLS